MVIVGPAVTSNPIRGRTEYLTRYYGCGEAEIKRDIFF